MVLAYLRPDSDDSISDWTDQAGGTTSLYATLDETSAGDTDYIKSPVPAGSAARFRLSNPASGKTLADPVTVRYRFKKILSTDQKLDVTLKQGSTAIATWSHTGAGLTTSFQTVSQTLTTPQLAAITDFDSLFVEFQASASSGDTATGLVSYWPMNDSPDIGTFVDSQASHNGTTAGDASLVGGDHLHLLGSGGGQVADHAAFNVGASLSIFLWVNGAAAASKIFLSQYSGSDSDRSWAIGSDASGGAALRILLSDNGTNLRKNYAGSQTCLDSTWRSVAFVFNGAGNGGLGTLKLYVNGTPDPSPPTPTTDDTCASLKNSATHLGFGCLFDSAPNNSPGGFFTGDIRKVRLYNTVKTDADIAAIHALG